MKYIILFLIRSNGVKKEIFRIIDANLNRSREGLRVCEEITRFALNSPSLTKDLKAVRHSVTSLGKPYLLRSGGAVESRDSVGDVGRRARSKSEMRRLGTADIFSANIERVKESLRVLEEFFKLVDKKASAKFTRLRFQVYEIEGKAIK
ncbi:MAG: thiamine-phosphate pyrophosphorylase [Candidatus Omnitrophota bacterium]|nr:thiamine-phosphate pyrophosphorylase [Candidatus Omnitrophota bacterium]